VPPTGWRSRDIEDLGGRDEVCEWCGIKRIRYVHVMSHPDWEDLVRVGSKCAEMMGDPSARQREREFRRNREKWYTRVANGLLFGSERHTARDLLRRWWTHPKDIWVGLIWALVILAILVFLSRR
jgi:hypothetical protein